MINLIEEQPVNLAGVAVRTKPANSERVAQALNAIEGVEVHLIGENGQLVVTVEEPAGQHMLVDTIHRLNNVPGVIATSLIYSHSDDALVSHQENRQ